jgi:hypothetical protein
MPTPRPDTSLAAALSTIASLETARADQEASRQRMLERAREQKLQLERLRSGYSELQRSASAICEAESHRQAELARQRRERAELAERVAAAKAKADTEARVRLTRVKLELLTDEPPRPKSRRIVASLAGAAAAAFLLAVAWAPSSHVVAEMGLVEARADIEAKKLAIADRAAEIERLRASVDELDAAARAHEASILDPVVDRAPPESAEASRGEPKNPKNPGNPKPKPPKNPKPKPPKNPKPAGEGDSTRVPIDLDAMGDDPLGNLGG